MGVWNTILSSLCCKEDKTNWAFHMYKIYQQYEDNLLRRVLQQLRKSKMISLNKKAKKQGVEEKIPLNANPYQLSVTFLHKFISRYQPDVYSSIKKFLKSVDESPTNSIEIAFGSEGGAAASTATLASLEILKMKIEVPEQVVVLDPNLSQNNTKFATMVEKYKEHHHQKGGNVKMNEVLNIK